LIFENPNVNSTNIGFEYFNKKYDLDAEDRAIFFKYSLPDINHLNMSHPGLGGPLTLEPCHPYTKDQVPIILAQLGYPNELIEELISKGFNLVSIPLISLYYPEYADILKDLFSLENCEYLFDPYYGVAFKIINGEIVSKYIENFMFILNLKYLQNPKKKEFFKNKVMSLSEGVQFGRKIFREKLGENYLNCCENEKVGELIIESEEDFFGIITKLQKCVRNEKNVELWFRGQTFDYLMFDRRGLSQRRIVQYGNYTDSMLVPLLYRCIDDKFENIEKYKSFISCFEQWVEFINEYLGPRHTIVGKNNPSKRGSNFVSKYDPTTIIRECNKEGELTNLKIIEWNFGLSTFKSGLLLQHYGAPTGWLDITKDPQVALWMATHRYSKDINKYQAFSGSENLPSKWPTIFVFLLRKNRHPYLDSSSILEGTNILRPQRQKCGLLGGSSNLSRNHTARYISLKIRISPKFKKQWNVNQNYFFPDPAEDIFLQRLLKVNSNMSNVEFEVFNPK
jgi:hypothetical protein